MHGDSASHFDADALDRAWDDLVRGGEGGEYPELAATVHDLSALIPAPAGGARDRVWRRLAPAAVSRAAGRRTLRIALVPQPLPPALAQPRRWFSSPKLALEGFLACLLIATLAFAITSSRTEEEQPERIISAASPQPQPAMDPWHLRDLRDQAVPASTTWTGGISEGKVYLALSEIVFPTGTGFVNDAMSQPSIYLLAVMHGSVTVTVDDQAPQTLTAGESASFLVIRRAEVRNSGPGEASIIQALGWPGYVIPVASPTPAAATPTPEYYGYFLANAVVELPADQVAIRLEIADETTVSRTAGSDGYTLINAMGGPISLQVTTGTVGVRNDQPTRDEYLQGTGFNPIPLGATAIIGYNTVLAEPGSAIRQREGETSRGRCGR